MRGNRKIVVAFCLPVPVVAQTSRIVAPFLFVVLIL